MKFLKSEAGAIILWLAGSLFMAALLMPWLYNAGKSLVVEFAPFVHVCDIKRAAGQELILTEKATYSFIGSLHRAKPERYFSRSLLISALALLPLLIRRVKSLPRDPSADVCALRRSTWSKRLTHLASGLLIGSGSLVALALVLEACGAAVPRENGISVAKFFSKAFVPALGVGVIEELLFRGLLLGLWLRTYSVRTAWIGSSLMFSIVHFLSPPGGMVIADPRACYAGFEILCSTLGHFADPLFFVNDFTTLFFIGLLLGWCRIRTFSLWLPIGLHAGLVLALKTISMVCGMNIESPLPQWLIGNDLKSGLLPLAALGICFAFCHFFIRFFSSVKNDTSTP